MLHKRIFFTAIALIVSVSSIVQCLYAHDVSFPLPSDKINEYPFNMVGKVSSGRKIGSGVAISQKVVLSAAHSFFNYKTLDWQTGLFQWNLRHSPSNQSYDISARSYQYFSEYAEAKKKFTNGERFSSEEELNRDVITLIFYEDVADGGHARWGRSRITDNSDKMIVGYPDLDYSGFDPRRQTMHTTSIEGSSAVFYIFGNTNRLTDRLNNTIRTYETYDLSTGPGNSGGPVYGLITLADGTVDWDVIGIQVAGVNGYSAVALAIDGAVYDLIKAAESTSDSTSPDDHGDARATATAVELNRPISGDLETQWDIDYFRFEINSAGTITAFTSGDTDTLGTLQNDSGNLQNNSGNVVATNDDSGSRRNFLITRDLNPGTYYIAVSNFLNKATGPYSFRVDFSETAKLPDLVVDFVGADRKSVAAGEKIRVDFDRSNQGDKDSGEFVHGLYLSKDEIITTLDKQLIHFTSASMSAGASEESYFELTIPENTIPGIYYLGYILDFNVQIAESNKTNNTGYAEITVVGPISDSTSPDDHGDTRDTATTIKLGRYISGHIETREDLDYFRFELNSAGTITAFTTGAINTAGILKGDTSRGPELSSIDGGLGDNFLITWVLDPGTYTVLVYPYAYRDTGHYYLHVDFTETIKLPDLAVDSVGADRESVVAGELLRVDYHRSNSGDKDSGSFSHGFYLSKDEIITTSDTQLIYFTSASMSAGASERSYYELIIPDNTIPGIYYLGYILDFNKQIEESDETNNRDYAVITVEDPLSDDDEALVLDRLPDLAVDFVGVDRKSVIAGKTIHVDFDRSNRGGEDTGEFIHGFYLSKDENITIGDTQLVYSKAYSMSAGSSEGSFYELIIPKNTIPGIYYLGYILDSNKQIEEYDETNNTDYAVITVEKFIPYNIRDIVLGGSGMFYSPSIRHPSGNIFDQVLLFGPSIKLKAKPGHITRTSFMDEDEDIVQVEFSGAGTITVTLDPATFLPPALPPRYNQKVEYVTGKPSVVIEGADFSTFFSIFTVGRINATLQELFPEGQVYDAEADVKLVEVINSTGIGGMQLSNTIFSGSTGNVGVIARGVPVAVRLTVGDIDADGDAVPHLLFGEGSFTVPAGNPGLRITGGDLKQTNSASIVVAESESTTPGFETLISQNNIKSDGTPQPTQSIDATFVNENGAAIPVTVEHLTIE